MIVKIDENLKLDIDRKKTLVLYDELAESKKISENKQWENTCNKMSSTEKGLFKKLGIDPRLCIPVSEKINSELFFECVFYACGKIIDAEKAEMQVEGLRIEFKQAEDFQTSGLLEIKVFYKYRTEESKIPKKWQIIKTAAYIKAKKESEYKIKIERQNELCSFLKSRKIQFVPLSKNEVDTYLQVWSEIIANGKKLSDDRITDFFKLDNPGIICRQKADSLYDKAKKPGCVIILSDAEVGVKTTYATAFKSSDAAHFSNIVITPGDFSWTYCRDKNGKTYFYKLKGDKK